MNRRANRKHHPLCRCKVRGAALLLAGLLAVGCAPSLDDGGGDFQFPLASYRIRQPFANPNPLFGNLYHSAEDAHGDAGTPVFAVANGDVSYSGIMGGYGWTIIIDHPQHQVYSLYAHVSARRDKVTSGEVAKGQRIAFLADDDEDGSGGAYPDWPPHLHFGLRKGRRADYPAHGDSRWMAGYTSAHPGRLGWIEPSRYIRSH